MRLGQVREQAEAVLRVGRRWGWVQRLWPGVPPSSSSRLGCFHVAMVDVGLQVPLGQIGALAALDDAAHVEGASQALLNALDRVCAAVQGQTKLQGFRNGSGAGNIHNASTIGNAYCGP